MLQKFDVKIRDKRGTENLVADHLSRMEGIQDSPSIPINDSFHDDFLMAISAAPTPWYADMSIIWHVELFLLITLTNKRKSFSMTCDITFGMTHIFIKKE